MRSKILFWLAVATAVTGMHSAEGHLFFFIAVHSSMLMIGSLLCQREKRGRKSAMARASSSMPAPAAAKGKSAKPSAKG